MRYRCDLERLQTRCRPLGARLAFCAMEAQGDGRYYWKSMLGPGALYLGAMSLAALVVGNLLIVLGRGSVLMAVLGWLVTGVIGLFLLVMFAQRVTARNPVILIDAKGLHDKRLLRQPVPWSAFCTHFSRHAADPTVFAQLRDNRRHLAKWRRGLTRLPYLGMAKDDIPLVLLPVEADHGELMARCKEFRSADLEARIPLLQSALLHVSQHEDAPGAFDAFVEAARDALFLYPVTEGMREDETCYATTETGGRRLDLYSERTRFDAAYPDHEPGMLFLADILPELIRLEVDAISFDRCAGHGFSIDKSRFTSLLPRL